MTGGVSMSTLFICRVMSATSAAGCGCTAGEGAAAVEGVGVAGLTLALKLLSKLISSELDLCKTNT